MARELSAVLDHVAKINELDLEKRAADDARGRGDGRPASRRADPVAAARAHPLPGPRGQRRGLPGSQPAGIRRATSSTCRPARAAAAIRAGSLSSPELFEVYRERAAGDRAAGEAGLNCFTWSPMSRQPNRPTRRSPGCRSPSRTCSAPRHPQPGVLAQSSRAICRRTRRRPSPACAAAVRGCSRRPTRTSSRWGPPTRTRRSGRCATRGTAARPGRLLRRESAAAGGRGAGPVGASAPTTGGFDSPAASRCVASSA